MKWKNIRKLLAFSLMSVSLINVSSSCVASAASFNDHVNVEISSEGDNLENEVRPLAPTEESEELIQGEETNDISQEKSGDDVVRFGVISDTHVGPTKITEQQRLKKAFEFYSKAGLDSLVVAGDITDQGTKKEYDVFKNIKDENLEIPLVASMGNHEGNTAAGFLEATGNKPNDNKVINGYHFITVSPGSGTLDEETGKGSAQGGGNYEYTLNWLKEQLDEAVKEDPTKPIFVFFHHPIKNTFYVSNEWYGYGLDTIFKDYPQVVSFSGHIHSPNNMPTSIWQDGGYTAVNTVTLSYMEMETGMIYGSVPPNAKQMAQGLVVEVDGSEVSIKNYDFLANDWIDQTWSFDVTKVLPYTKDRAEKTEAPTFSNDDKVTVSDITDSSAMITFDQAEVFENTVGDLVHSYRYDFIDKKTNKVDKSFKTWSNYYIKPMPETISQVAEDLTPGVEYEVRIYPINAYEKVSDKFISTSFKTTGEKPGEPNFDDMQEGIRESDLVNVDFAEGKIEDHSVEKNAFTGSDGSNITWNDDLGKYVAKFTGQSSEAFITDWTLDQYAKVNDSMTIESTFKVEKFEGSYVNLFGNMEGAGLGFEIYPNSADSNKADLSGWAHIGGGYKAPRANGVLNYGEWNHAALTYDGSKVSLYLNGEKVASMSASGDIKTPGERSRYYVIGGDTGVDHSVQSVFVGEISSSRMYSEALTDKEVHMSANRELVSLDDVNPIIKITEEPKISGKVGVEYEIPAAESVDNSTLVKTSVSVVNPQNEVEFNIEGNSSNVEKTIFIPKKSGEYVLNYIAKDRAGNEVVTSYNIQVGEADKKELSNSIELAKEKLSNEDKYEVDGIKALKDELALAEEILQNKDATQAIVDNGELNLKNKLNSLVEKVIDEDKPSEDKPSEDDGVVNGGNDNDDKPKQEQSNAPKAGDDQSLIFILLIVLVSATIIYSYRIRKNNVINK